MSEPQKQIRPKVRAKTSSKSKSAAVAPCTTESSSVEETRLRLESWMGLQDSSSNKEQQRVVTSSKQEMKEMPVVGNVVESKQPVAERKPQTAATTTSILKAPKYSKPQETTANEIMTEQQESKQIVICKNIIVERDPARPPPPRKRKVTSKKSNSEQQQQVTHHAAVEGYVPTVRIAAPATTTTAPTTTVENSAPSSSSKEEEEENDEKDNDPLILSSVEDLFKAAGQELPNDPSKVTTEAQLVEADISFSVMTQEQYEGKLTEIKREQLHDREEQLQMFLGNENVFGEDDDDAGSDGDDDNGSQSDDDEDDNDLLEMLMEQDMEDDDQEDVHEYDDDNYQDSTFDRTPRAFRRIWDALSDWITHEAQEWVTRLETPGDDENRTFSSNWTPQVDRSDIGASRCAGLMAMVKMYLPSCMRELHHPDDVRRKAEKRLGDLLRTFTYTREAPKMEVKLWKAMTCIFLDMVLIETRANPLETVPPSVEAIGMTLDEYLYLTRSAVRSFTLTATSSTRM